MKHPLHLCSPVIDVVDLQEVIVTPASQSVGLTFTATFTAAVSGTRAEYFVYQWRHNGSNITGQTGHTLIINNVTESDSGNYDCVASNCESSVTANEVVLIVTS